MGNYSFTLLDTEFSLIADDPGVFDYIICFMGAYEDGSYIESKNRVRFNIHAGVVPESIGGRKIKIHTSKHQYWNFYGECSEEDGKRLVLWPERGVIMLLDAAAPNVEFVYSAERGCAVAGEALFHAARGLALYMRDSSGANFIHSSGVEIGGKGVFFTGTVSAGKTTLLLECVAKLGAIPVTNDRVFIKSGDAGVTAYSWPSYSSFCEGTILNYNELTRGALKYQNDPKCRYRTVNWDGPLKYVFDKEHKRAYPMIWFYDCFGKKYIKKSGVDIIFLSRLDMGCVRDDITQLDYRKDREYILSCLTSQSLDGTEPSFKPWHGMSLKKIQTALKNC